MIFRSQKLLVAVRDLPCQWPGCGAQDGTVCAAHSNWLSEGKGRGLKASDAAIAALCHRCHSDLDQGRQMTREERRAGWLEAHASTLRALIERGYLETRK